jgi:hypothetical protein
MLDLITEEKRSSLVSRSRRNPRFQRSKNVSIITANRAFDKIDMNKLFKDDILEVTLQINGETDDYEVLMSFSGVIEKLKNNIKSNVQVQQTKKLNLNIIIKSLKNAFDANDIYLHCNCLHPDTEIKLLDGRVLTIENLCKEFETTDKKLYVYSTDEKGDFVPGEVEKVWKTSETTNLIEVTLDNDKKILTTPEHLYRLRDGSYLPVAELTVGQSLFSLSLEKTSTRVIKNIQIIKLDSPISVYDIKVKKYENFFVNDGVILHNCPDFKYRFNYWSTVKKYNSGEPELRFAKITNPNNSLGSGCKHTILVLKNNSWLIKVASVILNYIKLMQQRYKKLYDTIIYPAIFGNIKEIEPPTQNNTQETETPVTSEITSSQEGSESEENNDEDNT